MSVVLPMSTAKSQQASLNKYIKLDLTKSVEDILKIFLTFIDFTRMRPAYLHTFLGLVNNEVSAIRDEKPKLDSANRVLLAAHAFALEKGVDYENASIISTDGADAPRTHDWRGAIGGSSMSDDGPESGVRRLPHKGNRG
jgi:hypothetical protein